jgi:hypothetical protein
LYLSIITIYLIPSAGPSSMSLAHAAAPAVICAGLDVPGDGQEAFTFEDDELAETMAGNS